MRTARKAWLITLVSCACVGGDQVTKAIARNHLPTSQPITLLGNMVRLQYAENHGAFLGLGARLPSPVRFWAFTVIVGAMLMGMLRFVWISQEMNGMSVTGVSLILGGGFSNLLDRVLRSGAVVDFMNIGIGNVRTGIFNLADVAIMVGAGMLFVWGISFRDAREEPESQGVRQGAGIGQESDATGEP